MRGTVAKRLRREASDTGVIPREYMDTNILDVCNPLTEIVMYRTSPVVLVEDCTRRIYKLLKKAYRNEQRAS